MTLSALSSRMALLPVLAVLLSGTNAFAGEDIGVAKVNMGTRYASSQTVQNTAVVRGQSPVYEGEVIYEDCPESDCHHGHCCFGNGKVHRWWAYHLGYFIPKGGADGKGLPPIGHYNRVYAVDPGYFDQRDGNIYAAQGYGVPVAVPLAPNVHHTYNYSWGVPSSRLTPVGNITSTPY